VEHKIYDNLVPAYLVDEIEQTLTSNMFPWYLNRKTVYDESYVPETSEYQDVAAFAHVFSGNEGASSPWFKLSGMLLDKFIEGSGLTCKRIIRCRANYMVAQPNNYPKLPCPPHVDGSYKHHVLLYYVNESDGETILYEDGKVVAKVPPVRGRFLYFSGSDMHSASPPQSYDKRIAINYNLEMEDD